MTGETSKLNFQNHGATNSLQFLDYCKNLLTAGVSSAIAVTVMAPVERVKLILQVQDAYAKDQKPYKYTGMFSALLI